MLGFSADGTAIIVRFIENGDSVWKPLYVKDGTWGPSLEKGAAFASVIEDRKSGRIIGGVREIGGNQFIFFDNELQAHWNAVLRAFPNERVISRRTRTIFREWSSKYLVPPKAMFTRCTSGTDIARPFWERSTKD